MPVMIRPLQNQSGLYIPPIIRQADAAAHHPARTIAPPHAAPEAGPFSVCRVKQGPCPRLLVWRAFECAPILYLDPGRCAFEIHFKRRRQVRLLAEELQHAGIAPWKRSPIVLVGSASAARGPTGIGQSFTP